MKERKNKNEKDYYAHRSHHDDGNRNDWLWS